MRVFVRWAASAAALVGSVSMRLMPGAPFTFRFGSRKCALSTVAGMLAWCALCSIAQGQVCSPLPSGAIAWWPGDGDAVDVIGQNTATLNNGATFVPAVVHDGFLLDGVDDYVDYGTSPVLNWTPDASFTYEFWLRTTDTEGMILSQRIAQGGGAIFNISLDFNGATSFGPGEVGVLLRDDNGSVAGCQQIGCVRVDSDTRVDDGLPHHIAVTKDGVLNVLSVYIDGVLSAQGSTADLTDGITTDLRSVGSERRWVLVNFTTQNRTFFDGVIDELTIYSTALTPNEVLSIAQAGMAGKCGGCNDPLLVGQSCDDGFACTVGDKCLDGVCVGFARDCTSLNDSCNTGACTEPAGECVAVPVTDGSICGDGLFCNGQESCLGGVCTPSTAPCAGQVCDEGGGACVQCLIDTDCQDACTSRALCMQGVCSPGVPVDCDDSNACTFDSCDTTLGCKNIPIIAGCDDNNVCTTDDACSVGTCKGARIPGCFVCGDANGDDIVSATDALIALKTAVGVNGCADFLCDVDRSGRVTATDALEILKRATGQLVDLLCGTAGSSTTTSLVSVTTTTTGIP